MRHFLLIILLQIISSLCFSQPIINTEVNIADSGKIEFKLQAQKDTADYSKAFRILSNQVKLNPKNAELRYFLGYTIDRMNDEYGNPEFKASKEQTLKASEQFEEVNRLEPIYKGELIILGPYSKLSSVWGSLAQSYLNQKLIDSARWAFREGKKRGGFIEPVLDFNRQLLNSCEKNAILITYGDNITFPTWYLQTVENYRNDISIIDANLSGIAWYPKHLKEEKKIKISLSDSFIDTIRYREWKTQQVVLKNPADTTQTFSWELRPTYMDNYILKSDMILLNIFENNFFTRPIYYVNNSDSTYNLFLSSYLADEGLVNRVTTRAFIPDKDTVSISANLHKYSIEKLKKEEIIKSDDAIFLLNGYRWSFLTNIYSLMMQRKYNQAKELFDSMIKKFPKDKLPFTSEKTEQYFDEMYQWVINVVKDMAL